MADPKLPQPTYPNGASPLSTSAIRWGSRAHAGETSGGVADLVAWGLSAPEPLMMSGVERIAFAFYGGLIQVEDGGVYQMAGATKSGANGGWGGAQGVHGKALSWATPPELQVFRSNPATGLPIVVKADTADWPAGVGPYHADSIPTLCNIVGWGKSCPPAYRLTKLEADAVRGGAWAKVSGRQGTGLIDLTDARYAKDRSTGLWYNQNHPTDPDIGIVIAPASRPKHGLAGVIDAIMHDVEHDPLGALLLVLVVVSGIEGLELLLTPLLETEAIAYADALATGHGNAITKGTAWAVEHPAELGRYAAAGELAVAAVFGGGKALKRLIGSGPGDDHSNDPTDPTNPGSIPTEGADRRYWWNAFGKR